MEPVPNGFKIYHKKENKMNHKKTAKDIIDYAGGKENIKAVEHCATRLRIEVLEEDKIQKEEIEELEGVKGAMFHSGQYQIILGTGTVNKVYNEVIKMENFETGSSRNAAEKAREIHDRQDGFKKVIRVFSDVFVPIIPVLVATGLFMGLRGLLTNEVFLGFFGSSPESINPNFILYTQVLTDTAFAFLPALVCWSTFKVFGGSPVLGIVLGLMLVNPVLPNAYEVGNGAADPLMILGFIPVTGYQGSVLPAFIAGIIGAKFENWVRSWMADALDLLLTPFLTLLFMSAASLFIIGPVFHLLENAILVLTQGILYLPLGLAGLLIGGVQQVVVIFGIHHVLNALEIQLLAQTGANPFNPLLSAAVAGQAGAVLAVAVKTKDEKLKSIAFPSALSALLGITEPAIYGINLRFFKPFVCGMIGGAAGGFIASLLNLAATGMAVTVIPGLLLFLNNQIFGYIIAIAAAIIVSFAATWFFGYRDEMLKGDGIE